MTENNAAGPPQPRRCFSSEKKNNNKEQHTATTGGRCGFSLFFSESRACVKRGVFERLSLSWVRSSSWQSRDPNLSAPFPKCESSLLKKELFSLLSLRGGIITSLLDMEASWGEDSNDIANDFTLDGMSSAHPSCQLDLFSASTLAPRGMYINSIEEVHAPMARRYSSTMALSEPASARPHFDVPARARTASLPLGNIGAPRQFTFTGTVDSTHLIGGIQVSPNGGGCSLRNGNLSGCDVVDKWGESPSGGGGRSRTTSLSHQTNSGHRSLSRRLSNASSLEPALKVSISGMQRGCAKRGQATHSSTRRDVLLSETMHHQRIAPTPAASNRGLDVVSRACQLFAARNFGDFMKFVAPKCSGYCWVGIFKNLSGHFRTRDEFLLLQAAIGHENILQAALVQKPYAAIPVASNLGGQGNSTCTRFKIQFKIVVGAEEFSIVTDENWWTSNDKIVEMNQQIDAESRQLLRRAIQLQRERIVRSAMTAFDSLDQDGNGVVDEQELTRVHSAIGRGSVALPQDLDHVTQRCDTNGDGLLNRQNCSKMYEFAWAANKNCSGGSGTTSRNSNRASISNRNLASSAPNWHLTTSTSPTNPSLVQAHSKPGSIASVACNNHHSKSHAVVPNTCNKRKIPAGKLFARQQPVVDTNVGAVAATQAQGDDSVGSEAVTGAPRKRLRKTVKKKKKTKPELSFDKKFQLLIKYVAAHGHARVPQSLNSKEYPGLGVWVNNKRAAYRNEKLRAQGKKPKSTARISAAQIARLESVGFEWSRSISETAWERNFECLKAYKAEYGHARPPASLNTEKYPRLGKWVVNQRQAYRFEGMLRAGQFLPLACALFSMRTLLLDIR